MQKIAAKQVEGVVDLSSTQVIPARKQFEGGVGSGPGTSGHYPVIAGGFLYWVMDPDGSPQERDYRLGLSPSTGLMSLQQMQGGLWVNMCLDGCTSTTTSGGTGTGTGDTGGGTGGSTGCLVYGTMITLSDGTKKAIEDLEIGDVLKTVSIEGLDSADENAWKTFTTTSFNSTESSSTVVAIQKSQFSYYFLVNNTLKITFEHPVLIERDGNYSFARAGDIQVGDKLLDDVSGWINIASKERIDTNVNVVNINVESQDTYVAEGILVHNLIDPTQEKNIL